MFDVPGADAERYLQHVIQRGPIRLVDLAHHMAATGGPIELMDGSHASLVPLWEWHVQQWRAGFPGIAEGASSSYAQFLGLTGPTESLRATYAAEPFAHYLFEMVRRYSPDAHWGPYPWRVKSDDRRNEPAVLCSVWGLVMAEEPARNATARLLQGRPGRDSPTRFYDLLEFILKLSAHPVVLPPAGSILTPLLQIAPAPRDDPGRLVPHRGSTPVPATGAGPALIGPTEDLIVVAPGADLENVEQAPPLDEVAACIGLTALGGHLDGDPITPRALLDGCSIIVGDELALVQAVSAGGRLRGLGFEPINVTPARWAELQSEMRAFAHSLGAQLRMDA
ncbi:hypothetical protein [Microterricola viridarii]|nr:hypothetical protein [Microterricola viridarii]